MRRGELGGVALFPGRTHVLGTRLGEEWLLAILSFIFKGEEILLFHFVVVVCMILTAEVAEIRTDTLILTFLKVLDCYRVKQFLLQGGNRKVVLSLVPRPSIRVWA